MFDTSTDQYDLDDLNANERTGFLGLEDSCDDLEAKVSYDETARRNSGLLKETPLPWRQFSLVILLQFCEPLCAQIIYPFAPQVVRDLGVTNGDEAGVAYHVGILESVFFVAEALTVLHWSRISDAVGRKPVILVGLFGLALSMYSFGLSQSFFMAAFSRALNGALNGNIGVLKSLMGELTDETNVARAFAYNPITWSIGSTIGPYIGGVLSNPAQRFPAVFGNDEFLRNYPYFLPCAVAATFCGLVWLIAYLFLEETNPTGVSIWQYTMRLTGDGKTDWNHVIAKSNDRSLTALLTPRVLLAGGNYAILSLVDIMYRAIQPVFYSTPFALGGLGMSEATIGTILAVVGLINGAVQWLYLADLIRWLGPKTVYIHGLVSGACIIALFPVMNLFATSSGQMTWALWALVILQQVLSIPLNNSYGSIFVYVTAAAPSKWMLGATNGLTQMAVSIMRAVGPGLGNTLLSLSLKLQFESQFGFAGGVLVYCVILVVAGIAILASFLLPEQVWKRAEDYASLE